VTEPTRVELTVLGERLTLRTAESPAYIQSLADYLEQRVRALGTGSRTQAATLILAALDITDELFRARDEKSRVDGHLDARLRKLLSDLERAAPPDR
jgi:cell division protein ZapA (FtsZ GTPase activity inhibitor)